jgi:4'-phosphopantetheinyl transferase
MYDVDELVSSLTGAGLPRLIHVWQVDLSRVDCRAAERILSIAEQAAAGRYRFARDRMAFSARRIARRQILSLYTGEFPENLTFGANAWGKPYLAGASGLRGIEFSTSCSGNLALIAVAFELAVGIDVQFETAQMEMLEVAERLFHEADLRKLRSLPEASRTGLFYQLWTRAEAIGKAVGTGLGADCVSTVRGPRFELSVDVEGEPRGMLRSKIWTCQQVQVGLPGWQGAICVNTDSFRVRYLKWP